MSCGLCVREAPADEPVLEGPCEDSFELTWQRDCPLRADAGACARAAIQRNCPLSCRLCENPLGQDRDPNSAGDMGIGVAIGFCIGVATFFLVWRMMVYYLKNKKATSGKDVELKDAGDKSSTRGPSTQSRKKSEPKYEAAPTESLRAEMPAGVSATAGDTTSIDAEMASAGKPSAHPDEEPLSGGQTATSTDPAPGYDGESKV